MSRGRGRKQPGWFSRLRASAASLISGGVFAEGWGLPIAGFAVTLLISVTVFLAFLHSADVREMTSFDWGIIGAIGAFMCQFGANCCLLRFNRIEWEEPNRIRKAYVFAAFLIFSGGSAYGIHHAQSVYRESGYVAERATRAAEAAARAEARRPIEERRDAALAQVSEAANILAQIAASTGVSSDRTDARREAANAAIANQNLIITQADVDLSTLPRIETLPEQRPWDHIDTALAIFCTLLALLEFFIYSSLHPRKPRERKAVVEAPAQVEVTVIETEEAPRLVASSNVMPMRAARAPRAAKPEVQRGASWSDARGLLDRNREG